MPLVPPGHAAPMPVTPDTPAIEGVPNAAPPIPGTASNIPPPPNAAPVAPAISPAIHQPEEELATVSVVDDTPAPVVPAPAAQVVPSVPQAAPALAPMNSTAPGTPPPTVGLAQPAPSVPAVAQAPAVPAAAAPAQNMMPAGAVNSGTAIQQLEAQGFEGLEIGFGSFPVINLQGKTFSNNAGDTIGEAFLCIIHSSRNKWLHKKEENDDSSDFVYSFDNATTTGGKAIDEVYAEWEAQGFDKPVVKHYLDLTAQFVDGNQRTLGEIVILSVPHNSVGRLTGYLTTLTLGQGLQPNEVVTLVQPGQLVTSGKKPFHPWAFKFYSSVAQLIG